MDDDGHIFIVDHKKDMVLSERLQRTRVKSTNSCTVTKVLNACSFGVPDPKRERAQTRAGAEAGEELTEAEVRDFCKEHLSGYKVPQQVIFVDELPLTPIGASDRKKAAPAVRMSPCAGVRPG